MSEEKKGIELIDMAKEMERTTREILETDHREDQFRSLKVLMIYQASLLERIVGFIDAFMNAPEKAE